MANYSSVTAGVEGFTKAASLELASLGITVNCIAPGLTRMSMLKVSPEMDDLMVSQAHVKRLADPEDISTAILFLALEAAAHITGATLRIDGGRTSYCLG